MYYGIVNQRQAYEMALAVCDATSHGSTGKAMELLLETAAQETHLGQAKDRTLYGAGHGITQFDRIGFVDVQHRTRGSIKKKIWEAFRVEIDQVQFRELEYAPLLAFIWCRLKYLLVRDAIPITLEGRADYWKEHYNTRLGKGKPSEYIHNAIRFVEPILESDDYENTY